MTSNSFNDESSFDKLIEFRLNCSRVAQFYSMIQDNQKLRLMIAREFETRAFMLLCSLYAARWHKFMLLDGLML